MAHNINRTNGKDSFFSVKQKAWHGLGQIVEDYPTSAEAIVHAGLDFEVEKRRIFTHGGNESFTNVALDMGNVEIKNFFATARKDTDQILGVVGSKYEVVQNKSAFVFFDSLVADNGIKYETAGALGNGERIFITAKMPDVIKIGRKDIIEEYIFLTTSHDGSGSIIAAFTPVRIVCNNTLNMALKNHSNAVFIKHTANAEVKLKEAARIIQIAETTSQMLDTLFNKWAKVKVTDVEVKKLIRLAMSPDKEVFQSIATGNTAFEFSKYFEDVCGQVFEYAMTSPSQQMETTKGTLFGAYNAVTGYFQNVKTFTDENAKLNSIMFGAGLDKTKKAFEICNTANEFLN